MMAFPIIDIIHTVMHRPIIVAPLQRAFQNLRRGQAARPPIPLSQQVARLRWQVPLFALLLVLIQQTVTHFWFSGADTFNLAAEIVLYGLIGPWVVWLALGWIERQATLKEMAETELVRTHAELTRLNRRISFLLKVNQRLGETTDEESLSALILQLPGEILPTLAGCSLTRFDDHHQPMPVLYRGALEEAALAEWHQHLSSSSARQRCAACQKRSAWAGHDADCPLFQGSPLPDVSQVICLPLERNGREFGMLSLFLTAGQTLSDEDRRLMEALLNETTVAFENARLRSRELATLYEVNETLQLRLDFDGLMNRILSRTMEASRAEAGLMLLQDAEGTLTPCATTGDWKGLGRLPVVESLAAGVMREGNGEPVVATLHGQPSLPDAITVMCAPMVGDDGPLGAIVLGSPRRDAFVRQQTRLVSAIAGQAALLAQNARLYARLEHQAILAERARLAREMHDGLAQTLGYLKMRAGQISRWVETGQMEQASDALHELAHTANDAYLDLRAALDGLRLPLAPESGTSFAAQLRRLAETFANQSGLHVEVALEGEPQLSASAQAHLLRIVQEALTNARKHAQASRVRLTVTPCDQHTTLLVEDDGQGFDAGHDQPAERTHHGLQLMRERADLLGAGMQVTSAPGLGTRVRIELPVSRWPLADGQ
jgi:nitrate/nitrite-specific signal transduction histidine kinase